MWKDLGKGDKKTTVEEKKRRPISFVNVIKQNLQASLPKCFFFPIFNYGDIHFCLQTPTPKKID